MKITTSLYLDLMRIAAALAVFLTHGGMRITGGLLWQISGFGPEAVLVFFVLSGFVIAYSCDTKHRTSSDYLIARLARLWSVMLPALVVTFILDSIGRHYMSASRPLYIGGNPSIAEMLNQFWLNTLFLSYIWNLEAAPGSNLAFWSIPYEFFYYLLFGVAYFLRGWRRLVAVGTVSLIAGPYIARLFPIWMAGAVVFYITRSRHIGALAGWLFWGGSLLAAIVFERNFYILRDATETLLLGSPTDNYTGSVFWPLAYGIGMIVSLNIIGFHAIGHHFAAVLRPLASPIRFISGLTFAIYLFHTPLLMCFSTIITSGEVSVGTGAMVDALTLGAIVALSLCCDRFKTILNRGLRQAAYGTARVAS